MNKKVIKLTILIIAVIMINMTVYAASLSKTSIEMKVGDTVTINAYGAEGAWVSSMPSVAVVDNGKISALSVGSTVVSLVIEDGSQLDCTVNVRTNTVSHEEISKYVVSDEATEPNILKPGYYIIISNPGKFGNYTILSNEYSTGIKSNNTILGNSIVELKSGETLKIDGCRVEYINDSMLNTACSGEFEVGRHIQSGDYIVETDNAIVGRVIVYSDISKTNIVTCYDIKQTTPYSVSLTDGQCVSLFSCKLVG